MGSKACLRANELAQMILRLITFAMDHDDYYFSFTFWGSSS